MRRHLRLAAALALASSACIPVPNNQPDAGHFMPREPNPTLKISGYVWDPEAWHFNFRMCGFSNGGCPLPPTVLGTLPVIYRSLVSQARVELVDPDGGFVALAPPYPDGGVWEIRAAPRQDIPLGAGLEAIVPYYVLATHANGGPPPDFPYDGGPVPPGGPYTPPLPRPNAFHPALGTRPIYPTATACYGIKTPVAGNVGVLDAVARYLTNQGTPTTFDDLVDPARFGGVVVFFAYKWKGDVAFVPAFGTAMEATVGQVLYVNWANPGTPPPGLESYVSPRGFYIPPAPLPVSPTGISVILLPPNGSNPTSVTFTARDPVTDPTQYRPIPFDPQTLLVQPGQVTIGEIAGTTPFHEHTSFWRCQP